MAYDHVTDSIGRTPLVRLSRLFPGGMQVHAKLELCNPGGSVKDRPARYILEQALADGALRPGMHVVESSSGNLAIALAMLCNRHGLRFTAIVDPKIAPANLRLIRCHGGQVDTVEEKDRNGGYLETRIARAKQLVASDGQAFWVNQYANPGNWLAHFHGEGEELAREMAATPPDILVLGVSTSGTLHGVARRLRQAWPDLRVVAVDAVGSVLFGTPPQPRELPGIGASRVPELLCANEVDEVIHVDDYAAARACRELVLREGILAGGSSGAVIAAIQRLATRPGANARIVTVLPDRGDRYLDSVYDDAWLARMHARHDCARAADTPLPC
ncbi:MAG TPA: 2,3-diaminopropionate biosynthesis protein SbnA [Stenotrophomonas sp.]|nr:2,3-diaminopropionate biosynthesis protein SbnA [Stenotrophomonas sp.]